MGYAQCPKDTVAIDPNRQRTPGDQVRELPTVAGKSRPSFEQAASQNSQAGSGWFAWGSLH